MAILAVGSLVVAQTPQRIKVTWNANTESDLAGYRVYVDGSPVDNVPAPTTEWIYAPGREGTFTFHVTALDTSGNESGPSNTATATISVPPAPPSGCNAEVVP